MMSWSLEMNKKKIRKNDSSIDLQMPGNKEYKSEKEEQTQITHKVKSTSWIMEDAMLEKNETKYSSRQKKRVDPHKNISTHWTNDNENQSRRKGCIKYTDEKYPISWTISNSRKMGRNQMWQPDVANWRVDPTDTGNTDVTHFLLSHDYKKSEREREAPQIKYKKDISKDWKKWDINNNEVSQVTFSDRKSYSVHTDFKKQDKALPNRNMLQEKNWFL